MGVGVSGCGKVSEQIVEDSSPSNAVIQSDNKVATNRDIQKRDFTLKLLLAEEISPEMLSVCQELYDAVPTRLRQAVVGTESGNIPNLKLIKKGTEGVLKSVKWKDISLNDYERVVWLTRQQVPQMYDSLGRIQNRSESVVEMDRARLRKQLFDVYLKDIHFRKIEVPGSLYTLYREVERGVDTPESGPYPTEILPLNNTEAPPVEYSRPTYVSFFNDAIDKELLVDTSGNLEIDIIFQRENIFALVHARNSARFNSDREPIFGEIHVTPFHKHVEPGAELRAHENAPNLKSKKQVTGPIRSVELEGCKLLFKPLKEN